MRVLAAKILVVLAATAWSPWSGARAEKREETPILAGAIPPYAYEEKGEAKGILAELVRDLARRIGRSAKMQFLPWARAQQMTTAPREGKPSLLIPLTRTAARESRYVWVAELFADDAILVTLKGARPPLASVGEAKALLTGALIGSPLEDQLRELRFGRIEVGLDEPMNARKLHMGHLDAWFVGRLVAPFVYRQLGLDPAELTVGPTLRTNHLYIGASPNLPAEEIAAWRAAFAAAKGDGTWARIVAAYK